MTSFKPSSDLISAVQLAASMSVDGRKYIDIPYVLATEENLNGFAKLVALDDKSEEQVNCVKWPSPNGRPVVGGVGGGIVEDEFVFHWTADGVCRAETENVQGGFACGTEKDGAIWAMEANNHPDGDQIFWPLDGKPMIIVLSKHANEATVDPRTFAAFYLDGTKGINVLAGVYHLVAFPVTSQSIKVLSKQRKVHASVDLNFLHDFDVYVRIPNFKTVPESTELPELVTNAGHISSDIQAPKLPKTFARTLKATEATNDNLKPYGQLIKTPNDSQDVEVLRWPAKQRPVMLGKQAGAGVHQFLLAWEDNELHFTGIEGAIKGASGKPGVTFDSDSGNYHIKPFLCRPDGGFLIYPKSLQPYILVVAETDPTTKEPKEDTLAAFIIPNGQGVLLPPISWHSPPIPMHENVKLQFREKINATGANVSINIAEECGSPLVVHVD